MEYILYFFICYSCILLGWHLREAVAKHKLKKLYEQVNEDEEDEQAENIIRIFIEKHNDTFFVYEEDNKTFLGQGNSKEELDVNLRKRFPGKLFAVKEQNLIEVGFLP